MNSLRVYTMTLLALCGVDSIWLSRMGGFYHQAMEGLAIDGFRPAPAVAFYLLYAFGIVYFAVQPSERALSSSWTRAAGRGLLFGLVGYGVYDLTNEAVLKVWPVTLTLADMAWGGCLTALAATAGYCVGRET